MADPKVSILTTVYNGQRFVEETVRSVMAQTMGDFEYILVDDGSTDATPAILARLAAEDARLRIVTQANAGIARAANAGLAHCSAPILARTDADDLMHPRRLEIQLDRLLGGDAVALGTFVDYMDEHGRHLTTIASPTEHEAIQEKLLDGHCAIWNTSSMMRREAVDTVGGYDPDCDTAEDLDMWLKLSEIGRVGNIPLALQRYRLHATSVSETRREWQRSRCRLACERAYQRRGLDRTYVEPGNWRAGSDASSRHAFALQYGWWAFNSGERATAMHYAGQAVRLRPTQPAGWKLLAVAGLKAPPRRRPYEVTDHA